MPRWNGRDRRRFGDFLQRLSFHFEVGSRVDLSCFDIDVPEEVPNHVERDSTLQQVHSLGMPQCVRTHGSVQAGTFASGSDEVFLQHVADSGTRQPLMPRALEQGRVELFGTIEASGVLGVAPPQVFEKVMLWPVSGACFRG